MGLREPLYFRRPPFLSGLPTPRQVRRGGIDDLGRKKHLFSLLVPGKKERAAGGIRIAKWGEKVEGGIIETESIPVTEMDDARQHFRWISKYIPTS